MNTASKLSLMAFFCIAPVLLAEETAVVPKEGDKKPDNTARNDRERNANEKNPIDQNENKADLAITQNIRKAIVADKSLSTYAHNIKIITQDGSVTLKGPVRTADEKIQVEAKALEVAGQGKVVSQIEVAAKVSK